ncbi:Cationic amino acid transporter 8- vacuolar [Striga hermonthica]|uniref:Cationic amino acid transporter 8- vacuolar n=1 Tax=Striga hermonthica TaxID=68872 RepID=A0A9N7R1E8_STRHE|nr:Cationic amino acid transporter 8- vacuolar [Striga hermonthica]
MGFTSDKSSSNPHSDLVTPLASPPAMAAAAGKSYWRFGKEDFFPEPTFSDLPTYLSALRDTPRRLRDRLLGRSSDSDELVRSKRQSENEMKRCLTWWDLVWMAFGSVVGSGIFSITGLEMHDHAGPAIVISYALSGLSALLSVFCYTEFAVEVPIAGGSFSFLRIELGDFVAFIAAGNILLEGLVGAAGLGRSWSSYLASMIKSDPDWLRIRVDSFANGFNFLDPLAVVVLIVVNGFAMTGTKRASILNWISSVFGAAVIVFIIIFGFVHGKTENLVPFFPHGAGGVFTAAAVVYWSYTGFDMVANMAEEVKKPSRDIPIGLVGSMSLITIVYCLMALVLAMMVRYTQVDVNAAYSVVFDQIGVKWAKYLVSFIALKGMTTSMLVGSMGQARYTTQIARSHMIPPYFALVHPKTGTPIYATLLITTGSCILAFFSSLDVLSSVLSFSTLFIFMLMAVALLMRRYYVSGVTPKHDLFKFISSLFVVFVGALGVTILWSSGRRGWVGYAVFGCLWALGTLGMALTSKHRVPKVWGVPLVPWLPCLSIGMNLFLIGSLGRVAVLRFLICSAVMLVYYVLAGVHATYDMAHADGPEAKMEGGGEFVH